MAIDTRRIEAAVAEILAAIGEDVTRPGLQATPKRVAAAYAEFFSGLAVDPLDHLAEAVDLEAGQLGEVVIVRDIRFRSICEHHLLPFIGTAHVAYVPDRKVVGLGSLAHVVETLADRPQLQERLGEEIADAIDTGLDPLGVLVVLDAAHQCVTTRGPRQSTSSTVTLASRGTLSETSSRAEIISLIGGGIRE
ncbi:GTP cyclohydrolase I FolE [Conyzicola nivalis]|uniref:GTP cyclohydrolase 1 n=1 Tax=Conyzicola nivalis TaxID=1477021 RepID=A0A916SPD9_9MICO|nr:GTP cyclohydrolase I FolE [Conyzicola nivalis]GGB10604.1 GTP cyclohydrolase 1 [Conyzicola nivalis]